MLGLYHGSKGVECGGVGVYHKGATCKLHEKGDVECDDVFCCIRP